MARNKKPTPAAPPVEQPQQPAVQEQQAPVEAQAPEDAPALIEPPPAPAPEVAAKPSRRAAEVESLAAYAERIEEAAQPLPVCEITHPEAKNGAIHAGKYAGIRLVHGDRPAALLSDGSTI